MTNTWHYACTGHAEGHPRCRADLFDLPNGTLFGFGWCEVVGCGKFGRMWEVYPGLEGVDPYEHLRGVVEEVIESLKRNRSYYTDRIMAKLQRALVMEE